MKRKLSDSESTDPAGSKLTTMRRYFYQTCTEFGWYQIDSGKLTGPFYAPPLDSEFHPNRCDQVFLVNQTQLEAGIQATNDYYGGLNLADATRIIFWNGKMDPWRLVKTGIT